jgi:peptidoglycan/LPS O-acetylase OafA/YrhL
MENPNLPFGWRPALDGLRGIAVLAVVIFHFKTKPLLPGGSLGVDLFFALSGFLITTLLIEEWLSSGTLSLRGFYLRRFLRLYPALLLFVVVAVGVYVPFHDASFTRRPPVHDTLTNAGLGLAYVYSWAIAFDRVPPSGFGHLWSLSVEEQYYVIWPGLLLLMLKCRLSLRAIIAITAALAIVSACVPAMLGGAPWHRLYYGADYRVHGLLIGSIAGMLFAGGIVRREHARGPLFIAAVGAGSAYIAALMLFATDKAAILYTVGFPLLGIGASLAVIACAFVDGGLPLLILGNRVMVYVGRRSYAIYLWHVPIGQWLGGLGTIEQLLLAGSATLLAAEASHWLVERPALSLKRRLSAGRHPAGRPTEAIPAAVAEPGRAAA